MFEFEKNMNGQNFEKPICLPSTASETYTAGEVLKIASGALTKAAADSDGVQQYICCEDYVAPASGNRDIFAYPIIGSYIFRTQFSVTPTSIVVGDKVTLDSACMKVTATTTKGVAEIVDMLGATAAADDVLVKL